MQSEGLENINPFIFGVVVDQPHYCSRKELESRLTDRLLSGQNVYLMGPRRVGKTSLIERIGEKSFKQTFIRVDFMTVKSSEEATEWILNAWLAYEKKKRRISQALEFISDLNIDVSIMGNRVKVDSGSGLKRLSFDDLFARLDQKPKKNQPPFLLFFDEFQALLDLDKKDRFEFLGRLRKGIQHLKYVRVVYAGSVRHALHQIFQDASSPFYNAAEPMEVGPIEPPERFHRFLEKKFIAGGRKPDKLFWQKVEAIVGGNPSDIQRLCAAVWETSSPGSELGEADVEKGIERIFEHENIMNYSIIEQATALQKKCLLGIAKFGGAKATSNDFLEHIRHRNNSSVLKALGHYVKIGVLRKEGSVYKFNNPYFREWLIRCDV